MRIESKYSGRIQVPNTKTSAVVGPAIPAVWALIFHASVISKVTEATQRYARAMTNMTLLFSIEKIAAPPA